MAKRQKRKEKIFYCPWGGKYMMHKCKESIFGEFNENLDFEDYKIMAQKKLNSISDSNINLVIAAYTVPVTLIIAAAIDLHKTVTVYRHNDGAGYWEIKKHTPDGSSKTKHSLTLR